MDSETAADDQPLLREENTPSSSSSSINSSVTGSGWLVSKGSDENKREGSGKIGRGNVGSGEERDKGGRYSEESGGESDESGRYRDKLGGDGDKSGRDRDKMEDIPVRYAAPPGGMKGRIIRLLPVVYVCLLICIIVGIYLTYHISPLLLAYHQDSKRKDMHAFTRGLIELVAFSILFVLFTVSFFLSIIIRPGSPDASADNRNNSITQSTERHPLSPHPSSSSSCSPDQLSSRYCKWCICKKSDRSHHCRVCRSCILRMDHHCPWIDNCVGWFNHKFFLLILFYGFILSIFILATMGETVLRVVANDKASFSNLLAVLLGFSLTFFLFIIITLFGIFHLYLLVKGMTTIEFCEKRYKRGGERHPYIQDMWNLGFWTNFNEAFGYNPFLWFLPIDNRPGDGKHFRLSPSALAHATQGC